MSGMSYTVQCCLEEMTNDYRSFLTATLLLPATLNPKPETPRSLHPKSLNPKPPTDGLNHSFCESSKGECGI